MGEHPHAQRYRRMADDMEKGNFQPFIDSLADDVEWWEVGGSQPIRGKENLLAHFEKQMGKWEITASVHDVLANDEHLVALTEAVGKKGDDIFNYKTVEIHHVDDEGKITHRWSFADDTQAVNDFFS
ncbi:MAG: nuclear transport factor 2 family protein [Acidimicrobiia bacterium]